jgi:hypothetical protein
MLVSSTLQIPCKSICGCNLKDFSFDILISSVLDAIYSIQVLFFRIDSRYTKEKLALILINYSR